MMWAPSKKVREDPATRPISLDTSRFRKARYASTVLLDHVAAGKPVLIRKNPALIQNQLIFPVLCNPPGALRAPHEERADAIREIIRVDLTVPVEVGARTGCSGEEAGDEIGEIVGIEQAVGVPVCGAAGVEDGVVADGQSEEETCVTDAQVADAEGPMAVERLTCKRFQARGRLRAIEREGGPIFRAGWSRRGLRQRRRRRSRLTPERVRGRCTSR